MPRLVPQLTAATVRNAVLIHGFTIFANVTIRRHPRSHGNVYGTATASNDPIVDTADSRRIGPQKRSAALRTGATGGGLSAAVCIDAWAYVRRFVPTPQPKRSE